MENGGILALWNDCLKGQEEAYEAWYQGEHLIERLGIPGFLRGRRYEAVGDVGPRFFTYYETLSAEVLTSPIYRRHVDDPTPETARIMSGIFTEMSRTVCQVTHREGRLRGGVAVTIKLAEPPAAGDMLAKLAGDPGVARAEFWSAVEEAGLPVSREEKLRGGDDKITACLFVETLREDRATRVANDLQQHFSGAVQGIGIYRLLCELMPPSGA